MKSEIKNIDNMEFQPFELKITVENEDQLMNLWHRFNANEEVFEGTRKYTSNETLIKSIPHESTHGIWKQLDRKIQEYNLRNYSDSF